MADESENLILPLLREIRAKQDEQSQKLVEHDHRFDSLDKKFDDWQETTATGLSLPAHANIRNQHIEEELADLKRRIERLEQAH
jgi:predicted  nucleic acid-binding Zn-ribbon protein